MAPDKFSIIQHCVGVEASFSLCRDVMGWRQSKTTGETIREKGGVRQIARANNGILAGTDPELDITYTENDLEMKKEAEERKLHKMAKVHDFLEMWQGSQNLGPTQKVSQAQNKQMSAVRCISDTEEIVKASWSLFQHDGVAAFKLSEKSPVSAAWSAMVLPGGRTDIINVRRIIRRINCHAVQSDEDCAPQSISDTVDCDKWNCYLENAGKSIEDCTADDESDIDHKNIKEDPGCPEQQDVSAAPNVPGLVLLKRKSKSEAEKVSVMVNPVEMRRNTGGKKNQDRMRQWFKSFLRLD
jgi:hypothetical protein